MEKNNLLCCRYPQYVRCDVFMYMCFAFVCRDLQLEEYVDLYWRDYPSLISGFNESCLIDQGKSHLIYMLV